MAQVPYTSFYLGPFGVYTSPTGMQSPITNQPYLGGSLHEGDYCDLQANEAAVWNIKYGTSLNAGRYRLVHLSPLATPTYVKFGLPLGWGTPQSVGQVAITAAGTGSGSGTITCSSTASGGIAATASVVVSAGVIVGVQLLTPGSGFTSVPTWGLTELTAAGITSSGTIASQMAVSPNFVSSLDATSIGLNNVRGMALCQPTQAQILANSWIVIQESGIAPLLPGAASAVAAGSAAYVTATNGVVTVAAATPGTTQLLAGFIGYTVDIANANVVSRVNLTLPMVQG